MSITPSEFRMLLKMKERYHLGGSLCTLGVQEIWGSHDEMRRVFEAEGVRPREIPVEERKYSSSINQKLQDFLMGETRWMHQEDLFRMAGFDSVDALDLFPNESPSILHNLNEPIPDHLRGRFDAILDVGTCEHVCDFAQGISNVISLARVGGVVMQMMPLHGQHNVVYFNVQPDFYYDVYGANGFEEIKTFILWYDRYHYYLDPKRARLSYVEYRYGDDIEITRPHQWSYVLFVGRKVRDVTPFVKPIQGFYVEYHGKGRTDPAAAAGGSWLKNWIKANPAARKATYGLYRRLPGPVHSLLRQARQWRALNRGGAEASRERYRF